jgi:signal transduction histidine kinase
MFRRLRLRLTLLYLLAAMLLTALINGGVYALLQYSFQAAADQALERKVALGAQTLGLARTSTRAPGPNGSEESDDGLGASGSPQVEGGEGEERYDAELAPVFIVPLDAEGKPVSVSAGAPAPVAPDEDALRAAVSSGRDLRTVELLDGSRYRLLTTRILTPSGNVYLQAGRSLADQEAILRRSLLGMLTLSSVSVVLLGWGSWLLAGRSLVPAQEAWDRQQAFVANASHELRTPLTLLRASAEVAQRKLGPSSPGSPLLEDVLREADHMAGLVEDLLLLSRLDAGSVRLEVGPVSVDDLLKEVVAPVERLAEDRNLELELTVRPTSARGDRARLRQIVLILLDNALRHVPAGGWIRVACHQEGHTATLSVADNGIGIAPENLPRVFERFYTGDGESAGSGLGLSIARSLVQAMHGEIRLESRPGEGTRVTVVLPGAVVARTA